MLYDMKKDVSGPKVASEFLSRFHLGVGGSELHPAAIARNTAKIVNWFLIL